MTTINFTTEMRGRLVRFLADGMEAEDVANEFGCLAEHVVAIARNHGYPDVEKLARAADIIEANLANTPVPPAPVERPSATGGVIPSHGAPADIAVLLRIAKAHRAKRIQHAADHITDRLTRLRQLIDEDLEKNSEKRRAEEAREAARAEVRALEQKLADARAKLRPKPSTPKVPKEGKPAATTAPRGEYPCRNKGCKEVITTPQGRGLHERQHCAHREQAAS